MSLIPNDTPLAAPLRSPTGRGRPYRPEAMATVQALIETTAFPQAEIAVRTGVPVGTVARWARRFGWVRSGEGGEVGTHLDEAEAGRSTPSLRGGVADEATQGPGRRPLGRFAPLATTASDRPRYRRYGPADREAARAAIEGSRASMERIERDLGISSATLARWRRAGRWRRPGPLDGRARPDRYKIMPGRPYAADAVEAVRRLVIGSELSNERIAERVGIAPVTVSRMIARRGWERPPAQPGSPRARASKRTAPIRESGDRRGRPYTAETVAAAREIFEQTRLPVAIIAARVRVGPDSVYRWKAAGGWTRPHHLPDVYGRPRRERRR